MSADIIKFPAMLTNDDGRLEYAGRRWATTRQAVDAMSPTDYSRAWQWEQQRKVWERRHNGGGQDGGSQSGSAA